MIDPCRESSEVALDCLSNALPPEYPIECREPTSYCCKKDFCNSDEVIRNKLTDTLTGTLHASAMGKHRLLA